MQKKKKNNNNKILANKRHFKVVSMGLAKKFESNSSVFGPWCVIGNNWLHAACSGIKQDICCKMNGVYRSSEVCQRCIIKVDTLCEWMFW